MGNKGMRRSSGSEGGGSGGVGKTGACEKWAQKTYKKNKQLTGAWSTEAWSAK